MWPKSILLESQALSEVLKCVEGQGNCETARRRTSEALSCLEEPGLQGFVLRCAMTKVMGETPIVTGVPTGTPRVLSFVETSRKWLSWVTGTTIPEAPLSQEDSNGAIQHLALTYWSNAVDALLRREPGEAQKLFRRATEFSSSYGVQFNQAIHWTYAASFFPTTCSAS